jgi:hypothetical protein
MLMTSIRKDYVNGKYLSFGMGHFRALYGGTKASKIKQATTELKAFRWRHDSKVGEYPESVKLKDEYRTGEFDLHEVEMKVRRKSSDSNLMRLGPVGMALTSRLAMFRIDDNAIPRNAWEHYQIERIRSGDIYSTRCDYRRFHSNFTSLSKSLRQSLKTTTNDQLTTIDIVNSQPLILGILTRDQSTALPLCSTLTRWIELTEKGLIYDFAADRLTKLTGEKWEPRPDAKELFVPFLFDRISSMKRNLLWPVFESDFRSVLDCILKIKRERFQALAHRLQEMEAEIMIDCVAAEYMRRYPDAPILSVHDELIVPQHHRSEVEEMIKIAFSKHGITPKVK